MRPIINPDPAALKRFEDAQHLAERADRTLQAYLSGENPDPEQVDELRDRAEELAADAIAAYAAIPASSQWGVLRWLPDGETAKIGDFRITRTSAAPPGPLDAVPKAISLRDVRELVGKTKPPGFTPWFLKGQTVLSLDQVKTLVDGTEG